ncbi:hypothetical protein AB0911_35140 [Streptomyces nigra]|uniref:hypothetical protein n=1 Tax=Streptomyces nigra TaxID=1827580 RepID=UPI0034552C44
MDPVATVGAAIVRAATGDNWQQISETVVELWGRLLPHQVSAIEADLAELRQALQTRPVGRASPRRQLLEDAWQLRFQRLAEASGSDPVGLHQFIEQRLVPLLPEEPAPQSTSVVLEARATDHGVVFQAGRDQRVHYRTDPS